MYQIKKPFIGENVVIRINDNACIPQDVTNTDYQAYLAWVEDGNVATEWSPGE